jgi:hypothetical protein
VNTKFWQKVLGEKQVSTCWIYSKIDVLNHNKNIIFLRITVKKITAGLQIDTAIQCVTS